MCPSHPELPLLPVPHQSSPVPPRASQCPHVTSPCAQTTPRLITHSAFQVRQTRRACSGDALPIPEAGRRRLCRRPPSCRGPLRCCHGHCWSCRGVCGTPLTCGQCDAEVCVPIPVPAARNVSPAVCALVVVPVVKTTGHASQCGGSRERKGFMVKVWWAGQDQREHELIEQLPGFKMACFRQLSDEI